MVVSGKMRDRVTIQQNTPSTDTQGGRAASWGTLATVWAEVEPASAGESLELREFIGANQAYDVTIRYRADVTPKMRLSWTPYQASSAKTLEIHGAQVTHDRAFMKLACAEVI